MMQRDILSKTYARIILLASIVLLACITFLSYSSMAEEPPRESHPSPAAPEAREDTTITLESLLREMTDRDAAARWPQPEYVCRQASSYDRAQTDPKDRKTWFANKDYRNAIRVDTTPTGKEWVIMEDLSPGCVTRIWLPILPEDDGRMVRFYLDGNPESAIEESFNRLISGDAFIQSPFAFISSDEKTIRKAKNLPPGTGLVGAQTSFCPFPTRGVAGSRSTSRHSTMALTTART